MTLENTGGATLTGVLYRAGDCYLQQSDTGYGFADAGAGAAGCAINANNAPAGRIEQWYPATAGARYMEAGYSEVWSFIATQQPFPNTCRCAEAVDNGAGISWSFALAPGARATYAHFTVFSPTGVAGPPPAPADAPGRADAAGVRARRHRRGAVQPALPVAPQLPHPPAPSAGQPHRRRHRERQRAPGGDASRPPGHRAGRPPRPAARALQGVDHGVAGHQPGRARHPALPHVRPEIAQTPGRGGGGRGALTVQNAVP